MSKARDIADLDFNSPDIDGGNIDGATIGGTTPAAGTFTTFTSTGIDDNATSTKFTVSDSGASVTGDIFITDTSPSVTFTDNSVTNLEHKINSSSDNLTIRADVNDVDAGSRVEVFVTNQSSVRFNKGSTVFNEAGEDLDFRVESDSNDNMLVVDAGTNRVGVGGFPSYPLHQQIPNGTEEEIPFRVDGYKTGVQQVWLNNKRAPYTTNGRGTQLIFGNNGTVGGYIGAIGYGSGGNGELAMGIQRTGGAGTLQTVLLANSNTDATVLRAVGAASASIDLQSSDGGASLLKLNPTEAVFNEGSATINFRVESNGNANMLLVDGGSNFVGIGNTVDYGGALNVNGGLNSKQAVFTSTNNRGLALSTATRSGQNDGVAIIDAQDTESSGGRLELHTMGAERVRFERDQIVFNEAGNDQNFRVESDNQVKAIYVDAGNDSVQILGNKFLEPVSAYYISTGTLNRNITVDLNDCGEYYLIIHIVGIWPYSGSSPGTRIIEVTGFSTSNVAHVIRNTHYGSGPTGGVTVSATGNDLVVAISTGQNYRWAAHCEVVHGGGGMSMSVDGNNG